MILDTAIQHAHVLALTSQLGPQAAQGRPQAAQGHD